MNDPYKILGVAKNATDEQIKKAFREKAILFHPDKNPGDAKALAAFQEVSNAYDTIKDSQKRTAFDNVGRNPFQGNGAGQSSNPFHSSNYSTVPPNIHDILNDMFGGQRSQGFNYNQHVNLNYQITLEEAYHGKESEVSFSTAMGQRSLKVKVPPAIDDGMKIRYAGLGDQMNKQSPAGDLFITISIVPHNKFQRLDKYNLLTKQTINYIDAMLGTKLEITAIDGSSISVTVPKGINPGAVLKAAGKGMRTEGNTRGDLLIQLEVISPNLTDEQLEKIRQVAS